MNFIDIPSFINTHITKRDVSMFQSDIENFNTQLTIEIASKSVLVIGGAGTIGSSFIKALLKFKPAKLIVVDTNENGLTELTRDLRSEHGQYIPSTFLTYPMNFGDSVFEKMFLKHAPFDIVANFAAHKHVRSEKDQFSIEAMITNNVFKANAFLDLLLKHKPKHFFCVSTDKAANPVNVMGASKKLMEELILSYTDQIKITTARFANVAFSNGSLLAGYIDRIFKKQPISCPEDVKRFFVSPEESGQICLLACILGSSGDIFFPKLESHMMINFKDITLNFFKTMGVKVIQCNSDEEARQGMETCLKDKTYPVYFFKSDTSGEKLHEEFYTKDDTLELDKFKSLGVIKNTSKPSRKNIQQCMSSLKTLMDDPNYSKASIIFVMKEFIPDFDHMETGKNLDQKM
ncbi:UDP-N-acetylglucosamine 4,6-dehydratase [Flavobacteriaceae bacterium]|nr:UDP-N-acetylglucosamine 4,6-dehydratase [Flavobacteriaceae bacterium]